MSEILVRRAEPHDLAAILALHEANHVANLKVEARDDGFVTLPLQIHHLTQLKYAGSLFVARDSNEALAGYVLSAPWDFYAQWPLFGVQTARFPLVFGEATLTRENSFQYGPVCVAGPFRGQDVLPLLFESVKTHFAPRFPLGATFINAANQRSLMAHTRKLGFQVVDEWRANGNRYFTLAFSTRK